MSVKLQISRERINHFRLKYLKRISRDGSAIEHAGDPGVFTQRDQKLHTVLIQTIFFNNAGRRCAFRQKKAIYV